MKFDTPHRRTVLKTIGASIVGGSAITGTVSAHHDPHHDPGPQPPFLPPIETPTWGSDETDDWLIKDVSGDEKRKATEPYTLIPMTGLSGSSSPHFPFHHDQVVPTPKQNHGGYNANWHTHNMFYDNPSSPHHNRPYNGNEVLMNSYEVVKAAFDFFLDQLDYTPPVPDLQPVTTNEDSGEDAYLNTNDQLAAADDTGNGFWTGKPSKVPKRAGPGTGGDLLFPTEEHATTMDGTDFTYGDLFGKGFFVNFTFVCPVRPDKS